MADLFENSSYESFPSRDATMKNIKEALESPKVRMIGLHGLSGVGKTTLVKEIIREALQASEAGKLFDVVALANVTRNPDITKVQGIIAETLGMKLEEETDVVRAARIRERLKNKKESTLIILDDLWAELDLKMLGIPLEGSDGDGRRNRSNTMKGTPFENVKEVKSTASSAMKSKKLPSESSSVITEETLSYYKGCKVLLISESKEVLLNQMGGKINSIYFVDVLNKKEAEAFFNKMSGVGARSSEFEKLATQIASKCNGLPMSIVTTARGLKDQSRSVWEDNLLQLERGKFTAANDFSTVLSYNLLENEELKDAFLLCARMGPDALIIDLVKYCIGLGFLQGIYTAKEAWDRVSALVGKLKVSGLLSDSYSSDHFTMSDTVRSAALSIASEEKHVFTMTKGKVDEWPDEDKLERYTSISLHHCDIIDGFPSSINCPKLRVLHVNSNDPQLVIPKNLFHGMKELRALILTDLDLSQFPSSIRCLTKLRMLCLEQCKLDEDLSFISELRNLRILSLSGSDIKKLPIELQHLTKLQIFDVQEHTCESKNASLSELRHLSQLTTLDMQIPNDAHFPKNLFFDKLHSYKIVIGDLSAHSDMDFKTPEKFEALKFLAIQSKDGFDIHSQK
ncbi:disease resistance protein, partial [Trifolium medium]|nr:disease resistance protein [Trifolium medium]